MYGRRKTSQINLRELMIKNKRWEKYTRDTVLQLFYGKRTLVTETCKTLSR